MNILHIILGTLPTELIPCVESVQAFANRNNYKYTLLNEIPVQYSTIQDKRIISNNMRVDELCKDKECCYFDWDVLVYDNFSFPTSDKPKFNASGDVIMYSGDTLFWTQVRKYMGKAEDHPCELGRIYKALGSCGVKITPDMILPNDGWKHIRYNGSKQVISGTKQ
jgi:hypothetical protein